MLTANNVVVAAVFMVTATVPWLCHFSYPDRQILLPPGSLEAACCFAGTFPLSRVLLFVHLLLLLMLCARCSCGRLAVDICSFFSAV